MKVIIPIGGGEISNKTTLKIDEYIVSLEVEQQLFTYEKEFLALGEQAKSKEYGQIYDNDTSKKARMA